MEITVLTLFPEMFVSPLNSSLLGKAIEKGWLRVDVVNLRDYAPGRHRQADDYPFGGGAGMVLKADVVLPALQECRKNTPGARSIFLSPAGRPFTQKDAARLAEEESLILLCGHYEGVDERAVSQVDETLSIGDYVLTGGELPALVVIDAVARLVPGVLGSEESVWDESFNNGRLEYPQYTRPREIDGVPVPEVLLSGNHEQIRRWRKKESLRRTLLIRPDLLVEKGLDREEETLLLEILRGGDSQ